LARIKHALKSSVIKTEDSETKSSITVNNEENNPEVIEPTQNENDVMFIAFGRMYSGTIRRGQEMYVLGPKHDPSKITDKVCFYDLFIIRNLYVMNTNFIKIIILFLGFFC
jgi:translation elongation factor EF-G